MKSPGYNIHIPIKVGNPLYLANPTVTTCLYPNSSKPTLSKEAIFLEEGNQNHYYKIIHKLSMLTDWKTLSELD